MIEKTTASNECKPAETRPPSWMDRDRKKLFRRILSQLSDAQTPISAAKVDLIIDLVDARERINAMTSLLDRQAQYSVEHGVVRVEVLPLTRQIDATTQLAHRIADKLGIKP